MGLVSVDKRICELAGVVICSHRYFGVNRDTSAFLVAGIQASPDVGVRYESHRQVEPFD